MELKYVVDHIPKNTPYNRRPAFPMQPEFITIHSTGNQTSTARNERAWLTNSTNDRTASYHIVVDEREAIEVLPLNESSWNAGDGNGAGNRKSIAIEICESGNRQKTLQNAIELTAYLLKQRNWNINKLKRHYDWSKKSCPRILMDNNWVGWYQFIKDVENKLMNTKNTNIYKPLPIVQNRSSVIFRGQKIDLDAYLIDNTNYVPLSFIAHKLGAKVKWNNITKTIYID